MLLDMLLSDFILTQQSGGIGKFEQIEHVFVVCSLSVFQIPSNIV